MNDFLAKLDGLDRFIVFYDTLYVFKDLLIEFISTCKALNFRSILSALCTRFVRTVKWLG